MHLGNEKKVLGNYSPFHATNSSSFSVSQSFSVACYFYSLYRYISTHFVIVLLQARDRDEQRRNGGGGGAGASWM